MLSTTGTSNDPLQDKLQDAFDALKPPWFYERKRGEWPARTKNNPKLRARYEKGKFQLDNEKAAQAAYAFHYNPAEARARKRFLFRTTRDGGFYERLFNEDTTPEWLLLPYLIAEYVARRKSEYQRQVRKIDPERASVEELDLLDMEWIKFADQVLVGAIAFYLDKRFDGVGQDELEELLSELPIDPWVGPLYELALRDLNPFFNRMKEEAEAHKEPYTHANFVKGNWDQVEKALQNEWRYRSRLGDPFDGILKLER
jgi:hypothetical protein